MVGLIRETFVAHLEQIDWMDGATRTAAVNKARAMIHFIGYPEWYHNRTALDNYYKEARTFFLFSIFFDLGRAQDVENVSFTTVCVIEALTCMFC